jgi:hypothetical protein
MGEDCGVDPVGRVVDSMALGTRGVVFGVAAVVRLGGSLKRPARGPTVPLPVDTAERPVSGDGVDATSGGCCGDGAFTSGGPPPGA